TSEWNVNSELDWNLLKYESHNKLQECVRDLNFIMQTYPSIYEYQFFKKGFEWLSLEEKEEGIFIFRRKGSNPDKDIIVVLNTSNCDYSGRKYKWKGKKIWKEIFNSNSIAYWGSGTYQNSNSISTYKNKKEQVCEIIIDIPALSAMIFC
ncbi:MAG: alpha amylase C-terminal domain-containing protein, partial [Ferruginibacter sp.]